jgi:hypothetical protein
MKNPIIVIHNIETNEVIEREMTKDEVSAVKDAQSAALANLETETIKADEKAAILAKLGITEDEAKLLLA